MQRFINVGLIFYLTSFCIDGALRYGLHLVGLEKLIYARDGVLLLLLALLLAQSVRRAPDPLVWWVLSALLFPVGVGLLYLQDAQQVVFGLKMLLPLLLGVLTSERIPEKFAAANVVAGCIFFITASGVFINWFHEFPWEGLRYVVDGKQISASLRWWSNEERRLAGFTRASYEAALYLLLSVFFLIAYARSLFVKTVLWLVAGAAIWLTTTKGILLVWALMTVLFAVRELRLLRSTTLLQALWLPAGLMVLMPMWSAAFPFRFEKSLALQRSFAYSYIDRFENTWPAAFENIGRHGDYLFGRGIGGIGTPQMYYEPALYNFADNLFVYLYTDFGILAVVYLLFVLLRLPLLKLEREKDLMMFCVAAMALIFGITAAVLENAWVAFLIGALLMHLESRRRALSHPAMTVTAS